MQRINQFCYLCGRRISRGDMRTVCGRYVHAACSVLDANGARVACICDVCQAARARIADDLIDAINAEG